MAFKIKFKNIWTALKQSGSDIGNYNVTKLSAALAYYTVFSLAPMLIVLTSVLSFFYGREATEGRVYGEIKKFVGADAAAQIQEIIKNAALSPAFTFASIIGIIALIFSATGVFAEIQSSINLIWNLKPKPKKGGILKMLKTRLLSFSMIVSLGFIALVSLLVNATCTINYGQVRALFATGYRVSGFCHQYHHHTLGYRCFIRHHFQSIARCKN